jgi:hypothetical protein
MKALFVKFMGMPVSVRISALFLLVVAVILAVIAPLPFAVTIVVTGSVLSFIRLMIYVNMGE